MSYLLAQSHLKNGSVRYETKFQNNLPLNQSIVTPSKLYQSVKYDQPVVQTPNGINQVIQQPKPQTKIQIQNIPIQKFYTDYEPVVSHQHLAYQREYEEQHQTSLGVSVPVIKTITDYQTIQTTNFTPIQVSYTDYQVIEHKTEYIPRIRYEMVTQHILASQIDQIIEQHPYKRAVGQDSGQNLNVIELVQEQKNVTKNDYITQQRVNQTIEYQEIKSTRVLQDSSILCPIVEVPPSTQVVVQQSIHEPQLNKPEIQQQPNVIEQKFYTVVNQQQVYNAQENFIQVQKDEHFKVSTPNIKYQNGQNVL